MGKLSVVVGGQFGSEAKGAVAARLARRSVAEGNRVVVVRVAGHNAGHTAYDDNNKAHALRTIPVAAVVPEAELVIAAGSEVNHDVLFEEAFNLRVAGIEVMPRLYIDPSATWLEAKHIETEGGLQMHENTGSTAKGVGAARADRAMRTARLVGECTEITNAFEMMDTGPFLRQLVKEPKTHVILEGTQGYGLGLHTRHYPLVTSSNTRAIDFLAMAGIDPTAADEYEVWVTLRRFPIRVAGPSGDLKGETSWDDLGLPTELTTVTKKPRRVGQWDADLAREAVEANGGSDLVKIALTMTDQAIPHIEGYNGPMDSFLDTVHMDELRDLIQGVEDDAQAGVYLVGTGPNSMIEID